ncbi:hypothetical protein J1N35_014327 [Gossypium stocksii]|uniref:Protein kinase domain-containing protein n=1 Tax=Gossypium stocksii TaxID=47602 RepID=A0A9D3VVV0_9ROSI|nr:hypothetical protein J1N35_014327 [Gossypium stocksii]
MVASKTPDPYSAKHPFPNFFSFWRKAKKPNEDSPPWTRLYRRFTLKELRLATDNFGLKIGEDSLYSVYKGFINGGFSETVAIKMYDNNSPFSHRCFLSEMELPWKRDHPNVLSLIGYCIQGSHRYTVFEYMPHGSLRGQLHSENDSKTLLSWKKRLEICIGAARGIEFLHSGNPLIIHGNIKTSNILLDNNWFAKISDFTVSKLVPTRLSDSDSDVSTVIWGTLGFIDPEYMVSGLLTLKLDVYSFGVVLFEVLSARKPMERSILEEQGINAMQWWRQCVEEDRVGEIMDPRMKVEVAPDCLKAYADIAYKCSNERGSERPSMADVVKRLELILLFQECFEADVPFSPSWLASIAPSPKKNEPLSGVEFQDSDISVSDYDSEELLRD